MINKDETFTQLKEVIKNCYCPYSNFRVGCILYLKNGKQITGVNIENAAYSPCICAERCAYAKLISEGYKGDDIELVALYTDSDSIGTMCGVCRQFMIEFSSPDQLIWVFNKNGFCLEEKLGTFLPYGFNKESL